MSGRLILLPKKSYTPWNPANVERVLRDERLDKERQEKERQQEQSRLAQSRIETLKQRKNQKKNGDESQTTQPEEEEEEEENFQHVNLFEKEEQAQMNRIETVVTESMKPLKTSQHETRVYLGASVSKNPSQIRTHQGREISIQSQDRIKREMDPMSQFLTHSSSLAFSFKKYTSSSKFVI